VELIGKKLGWELSNLFAMSWNRETYCERLQKYANVHSTGLCDEIIVRQLLICSVVILIRILSEHTALINNDETSYCLIEAFIDTLPGM
jgi:integrator complex subunit 10